MFTSSELSEMRATQQEYMMDTCKRLVHSRTYNDFGEPENTWTPASTTIECGLEMRPGDERERDSLTLVVYDAVMRLPINTTLDEKDRLEVTYRHGEAITSITFEIVSPIQRGPSGIRVLLKRVVV